ncbi:MAG: 50S ribosomal protein L32, partial [Alphaproteobacteria bacterium]
MAVPKKKTSKSRRNMRRSHHALKPAAYVDRK